MAGSIEVSGPGRSGEFLAVLPDGRVKLVKHWQDLELLMLECDAEEVRGDLSRLTRQTVSLDQQDSSL
jgi:hypothetical protein